MCFVSQFNDVDSGPVGHVQPQGQYGRGALDVLGVDIPATQSTSGSSMPSASLFLTSRAAWKVMTRLRMASETVSLNLTTAMAKTGEGRGGQITVGVRARLGAAVRVRVGIGVRATSHG